MTKTEEDFPFFPYLREKCEKRSANKLERLRAFISQSYQEKTYTIPSWTLLILFSLLLIILDPDGNIAVDFKPSAPNKQQYISTMCCRGIPN